MADFKEIGYKRVIEALSLYIDKKSARKDIVANFNKYAKEVGNIRLRTDADSLCSETVISAFYLAGYIGLIGKGCTGCSSLKSNAKKLGTWHSGKTGIRAGDIVLFGSGTPNHTEFAVSSTRTISGQYKDGGVHYRDLGSRTVHGFIRPKYPETVKEKPKEKPKEEPLTKTLYKVQTGAYKNRAGAIAASLIVQAALEKYIKKHKLTEKVSVAVISSGGWHKVQCGAFALKENADKRLTLVRAAGIKNALVMETSTQDPPKEAAGEPPKIVVWPIWFFEKNEKEYGDCTAILEYAPDGKTIAHCILIDTAKASAAPVVVAKLKAMGVTKIDMIIASHGHSDHYGGTSAIIKAFPVGEIVVPDCTELDKHQKSYGNALRRQAAKAAKSRFLKKGDSFQVGSIRCDCLYICPASQLKEHDGHHFVNNESMAIMLTLGGKVKFLTCGDLQNEGNRLLVAACASLLRAHIYKFQWHGDRNAILTAMMKLVRPLVCFSNYHHKEGSGRGSTRKVAEAVGALVMRNHENGDIYITCQGNRIAVTCSKNNLSKTFTI